MKKSYFPLWYRLNNQDRYLIWYCVEQATEDLDGVFLNPSGQIPIFISLADLAAYAQGENISLEEGELNLHNLDVVTQWLKMKRSKPEGPTSVNCNVFLAAWNLFADVSRSIGENFGIESDSTKKIYAKLFWGSNLPAVTPKGESYVPLWSRNEKKILREIMSRGLQMFRSRIKRAW